MFNISDEDIEKVERLFLKPGKTFDAQRRDIIVELGTADVLACAGSGKTTVLAAKLAIIADKLPLENGRGVCVLTHTNVAINEVINRLGIKGNILFTYPNFFGTIQAFVDKFLAVPAFMLNYGKRPIRIDDEYYEHEVIRRFPTKLGGSAKGWLRNSRPNDYMDYLKSIRFSCLNENLLVEDIGSDEAVFANQQCNSCREISSFKKGILDDGFLCYDDAYSLAFNYLRRYKDKIQKALSERFGFVFIDEMQDTDLHQIKLLQALFSATVTIQRIGDINQAIYGFGRDITVWDLQAGHKTISGSKRFSNAIAKQVENLCIQKIGMRGNPEIPDITPKVIIFGDDTINKVLPVFGQLIKDNNLHECSPKVFKAVGWIGKTNQHRTLATYWQGFTSSRKAKRTEHEYLCDYLVRGTNESIALDGANHYRKAIIRILLKVLRISEVKNDDTGRYFSETTLLDYLKKYHSNFYDELVNKIAEWSLKIQRGIAIVDDVRNFVTTDFNGVIPFNASRAASFINGSLVFAGEPAAATATDALSKSNVYHFSDDVSIQIATVHSVKGETHTATLYLETFFKAYDIKRIFPYMCGKSPKPKSLTFTTLKVAYVGMTRPTHLLCVAVHKDSINGQVKKLEDAGWDCIFV